MTDDPQPEDNLADEFRRLGLNLVSALQAAWENPERKRFQEEMTRGLNELGETLGQEADKLVNSSTGQQIKSEVEQIGERIRNTETQEKIRLEVLNALKTANSEIQKVINRWSGTETGTTPEEPNPPDQPSS